jgi:dihydrofolate synthase / folylpolyglutamate synthase
MSLDDLVSRYEDLEKDFAALIPPMRFSAAINLRLERITHLLDLLGNPHQAFQSIHVGGTSGKGSTSTMIASILTEAGYKTGLHLSPPLQVLNECYQLNNQMVDTTQLAKVFSEIKPAITQVAAENPFGSPSRFEAQAALAFCLFQRNGVDVAVIEVSLGGTLDATNVLNPVVAVLTNVGLDHTEFLGDTVEKIAHDKAGIIKPGQIVISGLSDPSTQGVVAERCKTQGATLWQLGQEFSFRLQDQGDSFVVSVLDRTYAQLQLKLLGTFQMANAACAAAAVQAFTHGIPDPVMREGLMHAVLPGRIELVQDKPIVILDGAHNSDKIRAATRAMNEHYGAKRRIIVLSLKSDKAYRDILSHLVTDAKMLIVTAFHARDLWGPFEPKKLAKAALEIAPNLDVRVVHDPLVAIEHALSEARPDDLVWVTGSLYLVGDVREHWHPSAKLIMQAEKSKL